MSAGPAYCTHPARASSAGAEATDLAARAHLILDPWQADVLDIGLGETASGLWAAREVALVVPRQNGKGTILEALILASLILFEERLVLYSAHEFKTASEMFLRVRDLCDASADVSSRIRRVYASHGSEGIELMSGQRLRFVARTKGSGRGFTPERVILDEAWALSEKAIAAVLFSLGAQANPQIWYASSAPEEGEDGQVLRRVMRRGRAGEDASLAYVEYCAAGDSSSDDETAWAAANPGFPHRIRPEVVATERAATATEDFRRERLGIIELAADDAVRVMPEWEACTDPKSGPVGPVVFGLDVSPSRSSVFVAASKSGRGGVHLEITSDEDGVPDCRRGTYWVVSRAADLQRKWGGVVVIAANSPAASLLPALAEAGVKTLEVSAADHAKACGRMVDAVDVRNVRHLGQPPLTLAADGAVCKFYGDTWLWDRRHSKVDISPLVAATLAMWALDQPTSPEAAFVDLDSFAG